MIDIFKNVVFRCLFLGITLSFCGRLKGCGPQLDYLIVGKDTFIIWSKPARYLDSAMYQRFNDTLYGFEGEPNFHFYCGYQAFWTIEDGKLFLTGLKDFTDSDSILRHIFLEKYKEGKVSADWFSSIIFIGKGEIIMRDINFGNNYSIEEELKFNKGFLVGKEIHYNYIEIKGGIPRKNNDRKIIRDTIFSCLKSLDWKNSSKFYVYQRLYINVDIGEDGLIDKIECVRYFRDKYDDATIPSPALCEEYEKFILPVLRNLKFDIVKKHGKPFQDKYFFKLYINGKGELEDWTSNR